MHIAFLWQSIKKVGMDSLQLQRNHKVGTSTTNEKAQAMHPSIS
jgi:hypothetical protein